MLLALLLLNSGCSERQKQTGHVFPSHNTPSEVVPLFDSSITSDAGSEESSPLNSENQPSSSSVSDSVSTEEEASADIESSMPLHLSRALKYDGILEKPLKSNRGPEVDSFATFAGFPPENFPNGVFWCATYVNFCLNHEDPEQIVSPRPDKKHLPALARAYIVPRGQGLRHHRSIPANEVLRGVPIPPGSLIIWKNKPLIADSLDSSGHIGIVIEWDKKSGQTIEGNTAPEDGGNQRNGIGVFVRNRTITPANHFRITDFTPVIYR